MNEITDKLSKVTPAEGAEDGALTKLRFRIRDFTASFENADEITALCVDYADARDAAALAEARAQIQQQDAALDQAAVELNDVVQEVVALRAQNAKLRAALEPFAKAADIKLCGEYRDDKRFGQTDVSFYLTFGDLRRARAALAQSSGGEVSDE